MSAGSVAVARPDNHRAGGGSRPTSALQQLHVNLIPHRIAKVVLLHHYLGSLPGATKLSFGVFLTGRLEGAVTLGSGPMNGHKIVRNATVDDYLCLTRLWLSDRLPRNSESKVLGIVARLLRKHTQVKFLVSYADPTQGHRGIVYQAAGWTYVGLSYAMALYSIDGAKPEHSRSLSHRIGSHSISYLTSRGLNVRAIRQQPKHKYVLFIDRSWNDRLTVPGQPYPREV